eukprot:gene18283-8148_t
MEKSGDGGAVAAGIEATMATAAAAANAAVASAAEMTTSDGVVDANNKPLNGGVQPYSSPSRGRKTPHWGATAAATAAAQQEQDWMKIERAQADAGAAQAEARDAAAMAADSTFSRCSFSDGGVFSAGCTFNQNASRRTIQVSPNIQGMWSCDRCNTAFESPDHLLLHEWRHQVTDNRNMAHAQGAPTGPWPELIQIGELFVSTPSSAQAAAAMVPHSMRASIGGSSGVMYPAATSAYQSSRAVPAKRPRKVKLQEPSHCGWCLKIFPSRGGKNVHLGSCKTRKK